MLTLYADANEVGPVYVDHARGHLKLWGQGTTVFLKPEHVDGFHDFLTAVLGGLREHDVLVLRNHANQMVSVYAFHPNDGTESINTENFFVVPAGRSRSQGQPLRFSLGFVTTILSNWERITDFHATAQLQEALL